MHFPEKKANGQLAKLLRTKAPFKGKYAEFGEHTLRKLVGRALDPGVNPSASIAEGEDFIAARADWAARQFGLPNELGIALQKEILEKYYLEIARSNLRERHNAVGREFTNDDWLEYLPSVRGLVDAQVTRLRNGDQDSD
jgi:hypothetical protein